MNKKIKLALIAGGKSGEREVSLAGAKGVLAALDPNKYIVSQYDAATDLAKIAAEAEEIDVAFVLLHGLLGEDGSMSGFLDLLGLPYQCSGVLGSALAMDKNMAKKVYQAAGLPVAGWQIAQEASLAEAKRLIKELGLPLVIKPIRQGSSLGMSIAHDEEAVVTGVAQAFKHDDQVMVEQFVKGREITVGVLGNQNLTPLPIVEIIPGEDYPFFDYQAKYQAGASQEICPADLSAEITAKAQDYGLKAHKALGLKGYSRTDMMVVDSGEIIIIETNTIPGMTPTSLLPQAAKEYGLSFGELLDRLIELAVA